MYAIIQSGGKQYMVKEGDLIAVDLLTAEIGSTIDFKDVLFFFDGKTPSAGAPTLDNCTITGELVEHIKGEKIFGMKYKRRKQNFRAWGHRQSYSVIRIHKMKLHERKEARHGT